jgi:hypothetical protein
VLSVVQLAKNEETAVILRKHQIHTIQYFGFLKALTVVDLYLFSVLCGTFNLHGVPVMFTPIMGCHYTDKYLIS